MSQSVTQIGKVGVLGHLDELEQLMREFLDEMETRGHATVYGKDSLTDWKFETFLQWLRQRQRESVVGTTDDGPVEPQRRNPPSWPNWPGQALGTNRRR